MSFESQNKEQIRRCRSAAFTRDRTVEEVNFELFGGGDENLYGIVPNRRDFRVLDVGCGEGLSIEELKRRNPKIEAHGIDVVPPKRRPCGVEMHVRDAHKIPYPADHFDVVYSCMALQYMTDKLQVLREVHRVLKTRGRGFLHLQPITIEPHGTTIVNGEEFSWDRYTLFMNKTRPERPFTEWYFARSTFSNMYGVTSHYRQVS